MDNNDVVSKQSTQNKPTSPLFPVLAGFIAEPFNTENSLTTPSIDYTDVQSYKSPQHFSK